MRKLLLFTLFLTLNVGIFNCSAQLNKREIKRNNKRIANFKGKKTFFPKEKRYKFLALSLNAFNYFGDLAPLSKTASTDISLTKPAIGLMFGYRIGPFYALRASFTYGAIRGSDFESADPGDSEAKFRYVRNLHFRNRIKELSIVGVFDLFANESTYISRVDWTPYAFTGITVFHHNPQAIAPATDLQGNPLPEAGQWVDLQPLGTEGQYAELAPGDVNSGIKPYNNFQIAIPFGVGVRYRINQVFDLSFEASFRYLFTDYLDDVSQNYVDLGVLDSELAKAMSYRSNELTDAESGSLRDLSNESINPINNNRLVYVGRDGRTYDVVNGFGSEFRDNMRGGANDNDMYFVTTLKFAYIIGATFRRAKFR